MMQAVNYGFWEDWQYPQKVTFDGPSKIIFVNYGVTQVDVKLDIYSAWKEWVLSPEANNAGYEQALRAVGGDPTVGGNYLGSTFFLTNGWRMRTWEGDHRLNVVGNLYTDEGAPPFIPVTGPYTILVEYQVSNLVSALEIGGGTGGPTAEEISDQVWLDAPVIASDSPTAAEISDQVWLDAPAIATDAPTVQEIADAVWDEPMSTHATNGSFGKRLRELFPLHWGVK